MSDLHKRRKHKNKVKQTMGKSQTATLKGLPHRKKETGAKVVAPPVEEDVVEIDTTVVTKPKSSKTVVKKKAPPPLGRFKDVKSAKDLNPFTVSELKNFCKQHGLSKMGKRSQLVERVLDTLKSLNNPQDSLDVTPAEDVVFDEDGNVMGDVDIELDESLTDD